MWHAHGQGLDKGLGWRFIVNAGTSDLTVGRRQQQRWHFCGKGGSPRGSPRSSSLLALARAKKASCPALRFSFFPPQALSAEACRAGVGAGAGASPVQLVVTRWVEHMSLLLPQAASRARQAPLLLLHLQGTAKGE